MTIAESAKDRYKMAIQKRAELEKLYEEMQDCKKCADISKMEENSFDLRRGFGKLKGYGDGRFMFVAQNPSYVRIPHIVTPCDAGVSRDLLWLLQKEGFEDKDIFFTNLVKCSTPNNRAPSDKEVEICTEEWLRREMKIIRPKLIVPIGGVASEYVKKMVERETEYQGIPVRSIWHPSYVFRKRTFEHYTNQLKELVELKEKL